MNYATEHNSRSLGGISEGEMGAVKVDGLQSCLLRIAKIVDDTTGLNNRLSNTVDRIGGTIPQDANKEVKAPIPDATLFMAKAIENALSRESFRLGESIERLECVIS